MSPEVKLTRVYIKEKGKFKTGRKIYISNNLLLSWNNNMQLIQPLLYHTQWWAKQNGGLGEEGGEGVQKTKKTQTLGGKAESLKILNKEFSWKSAWKRTWKRTWTASTSNQPTSCCSQVGHRHYLKWPEKTIVLSFTHPHQTINAVIQIPQINETPQKPPNLYSPLPSCAPHSCSSPYSPSQSSSDRYRTEVGHGDFA